MKMVTVLMIVFNSIITEFADITTFEFTIINVTLADTPI